MKKGILNLYMASVGTGLSFGLTNFRHDYMDIKLLNKNNPYYRQFEKQSKKHKGNYNARSIRGN